MNPIEMAWQTWLMAQSRRTLGSRLLLSPGEEPARGCLEEGANVCHGGIT